MMIHEDKIVNPMDYLVLKEILLKVMKELNKDRVDIDVKLAFSRELLRGNIDG